MAYEFLGDGALDYFPCRYGRSRVVFRGPRRDLSSGYAAALGGTETYGRFVPAPYPALLDAALGLPLINLGNNNAGLDLYLNDPEVMAAIGGARIAVVQVLGAANLSNRFYRVHPRRNDRFVAGSAALRNLYREADLTEFHFTRHLLLGLHRICPDRFDLLVAELRATWVERMRALMRSIPGRKILLWLGAAPPADPRAPVTLWQDPMLVTQQMLDAVQPLADAYLQLAPSAKALSAGTRGMAFSPMDEPAARLLPGPEVHKEIAGELEPLIRALL